MVVWRVMFKFDNWTDAVQSVKDAEAVVHLVAARVWRPLERSITYSLQPDYRGSADRQS